MSTISSWLLSIIGIVILGTLVNLILPDTASSNYIKAIYSFIVIYVIISPLISLLNGQVDINFASNDFINEEYIEKINKSKIDYYEKNIVMQSKMAGIDGVEVQILSSNSENGLILDAVYVYFQNACIVQDIEHIDKCQVLEDIITAITKIEKEKIIYYD